MNAVRLAVGCAATALVVATGLSHLSPAIRGDLLGPARAAVGVGPTAPASPPGPVAEAPVAGGFAEHIRADPQGQWQSVVEVEGERLPVLIDTGATFVALSYEDADRVGIRPAPADFRLPVSTANGRAYAAPVRLRSVRLGGIELRDVDAIVAGRGQLSGTLLGMSFLSRLSGVSVDHGDLVLRR